MDLRTPWRLFAKREGGPLDLVVDCDGVFVADCYDPENPQRSEHIARLIASAPDLFTAAAGLVKYPMRDEVRQYAVEVTMAVVKGQDRRTWRPETGHQVRLDPRQGYYSAPPRTTLDES